MSRLRVITIVWLVVSALAVTTQAGIFARFTRDVPLTVEHAELLPREVFNDGTYALIAHTSLFDRDKIKKAEASCPAGMKAVSAGFAAASGHGEPDGFRLILSQPTEHGAGWVIYGAFDASGDSLAAEYDWKLRLTVVCLALP
jgi:hypothetical protein